MIKSAMPLQISVSLAKNVDSPLHTCWLFTRKQEVMEEIAATAHKTPKECFFFFFFKHIKAGIQSVSFSESELLQAWLLLCMCGEISKTFIATCHTVDVVKC